MVAGYDSASDVRVRQEALALAAAGADVVVVGVIPAERRVEASISRMGAVTLVRVPVRRQHRDGREAARARRRAWRPPLLRLADRRRRLRDLEVIRLRRDLLDAASARGVACREAAGRPDSHAAATVLRAQRALVEVAWTRHRGQVRLSRAVDAAIKSGWARWDRLVLRSGGAASRWSVRSDVADLHVGLSDVLQALHPDLVHACGAEAMPLAELVAGRAALAGRRVPWVYDDCRSAGTLASLARPARTNPAVVRGLEAEFVRRADRVITSSSAAADELDRRYGPANRPVVVQDVPLCAVKDDGRDSLRERIGVSEDTPLLVWQEDTDPAAGVTTAVEALPMLPDVHLAVATTVSGAAVTVLSELARQLGVLERLHVVVPDDRTAGPSAPAAVGLVVAQGAADRTVAERTVQAYSAAGIPVVLSDAEPVAATVSTYGLGETFRAGDPGDLTRAVRQVMGRGTSIDPATRSMRWRESRWSAQEEVLWGVYRDLLDSGLPISSPASARTAADLVELPSPRRRGPDERAKGLLIGPANFAGQAWEWARAFERHATGVRAESLMVDRGGLSFPSDHIVPLDCYRSDVAWHVDHLEQVLSRYTHVLIEAGQPVTGRLAGRRLTGDERLLRAAGIHVAAVFHGSEVRDPTLHRELYAFSPYRDPTAELSVRAQRAVDDLRPEVDGFDGPVFVTTPDLLDFVPRAHWLPVVVDGARWASDAPVMERRRPVVLHAPSQASLKGSAVVDEVLRRLDRRGAVRYERLENATHETVADAVRTADVVVDQLLLGSYGVLACEAMAAGRVVVGNVEQRVRDRIPKHLPIEQADPDHVEEVLVRIIDERDAARRAAQAGRDYVATFHDGRHGVSLLGNLLLSADRAAQSPARVP